jgi:regulator of replication initiation timing
MADDRLIELMAEMLSEMRSIGADMRVIKDDIGLMKNDISELKTQQARTNLGLTELRLSNMKLAERIEETVHLDQRVRVRKHCTSQSFVRSF